jgi:acyl-CoA thioesterase
MIGPCGGVTAAVMLAAVLRDPVRQGEPIALTVNFAAPVADGPFELHARALRTNRSTQHWQVHLRQGEAIAASASAVTATRRETWSAVDAGFPAAPPPQEVPAQPPLAPARWTSAYEMRFVRGPLPLAPGVPAAVDSHSLLWVRDAPPRALDFLSLAALCDVFFPRIFLRRPRFVPAGTVSMTVYFHADGPTLASVDAAPVLGHARAQQFRNGYFDQSAEIWSAAGGLLAVTHQIVYYRE